jgi:photosystem II stability/assembly factor-like uncharacterized protein
MNGGLPSRDVHGLAMSPTNPNLIYIWIVEEGFYKTENGGLTWKAIEPKRGKMPLFSLAVSPSDSKLLYAGTSNGIILSRDGGSTWEFLEGGLPGHQVYAIAVHPKEGEVFAGTDRGLFRWDGKSWAPLAYEEKHGLVIALAFDRSDQDTIYALTHKGVILKGSSRSPKWLRIN